MQIDRIEAFYLEAPIDEPIVSAVGVITARPCLLARVEARSGVWGWGEIWCNFPPGGGLHRLNLLERVLGPWYLGRDLSDPSALVREANRAFHRLAVQSGEPGPVAQVIAGLDCAIHDLLARHRGLPLARAIDADCLASVPAYASGINPGEPETVVRAARERHFRAFKLKLGFAQDERNLDRLEAELGQDECLMVDLNQAWSFEEATSRIARLGARRLAWIEEPIAADEPVEHLARLQAMCPVPIAGGENLASADAFAAVISAGALKVIQPDVAKWGGISGAGQVARKAKAAGLSYCPHCLGGGIGLLHSAHLLAAIGGPGLLEIDINPNPLRTEMVALADPGSDGRFTIPQAPGIGVEPCLEPWLKYRIALVPRSVIR